MDDYIRSCGFGLVTIWECEWKTFKESHTIHNRYTYPTEGRYRMGESRLMDHIKNGDIFGAVEVDIQVPESLKPYFEEMPPIFKNTTVSHRDIGDFMQGYLESQDQTFKDTRYLIGSMWGNKILLITPLLKWYLEHGLVVTKVHQVVEFSPKRCFKEFVDQISDDRRAGDRDPNQKVIAETSKLIGILVIRHYLTPLICKHERHIIHIKILRHSLAIRTVLISFAGNSFYGYR